MKNASAASLYINEPVTYLFKEFRLSYRESQIAEYISQAHSNKDAADKFNITEKTVKFHLTNVYKKLRLKSRTQLIVFTQKYKAAEPMIIGGAVR